MTVYILKVDREDYRKNPDPIQYFLKHMKYFKQRYTSQLQCRIFHKHD